MTNQLPASRAPGLEAAGGDLALAGALAAGPLARTVPTPRARHLAEIAIVLVVLSWGANIVAVKAILADVPPVLFAFARFGTAFVVLLSLLRWREGSVGLPRRDVVPMLLLGLAGFGLYQDLWATALGQTTASNSALITAATPMSTMLIAAAIGSDTLSLPKVLGAIIALSGAVAVVVATHGIGLSGASAGDLMTFAATICWGGYVAFGAPVLRRHSPLRTATWAIGLGCLGMLPLALLQASTFDVSRINAGSVGIFLFSALLVAAVGNVLMFEAVKVLGPARAMLFQFLVPAFAVILAALLLGESIVMAQILGGLVIVAGILVSRLGSVAVRR